MKTIFKSVEPVLVAFATLTTVSELIFPALTAADTFLNYAGSFLTASLILFIYTYIKHKLK